MPEVVLINPPPFRISEPRYDTPRFTRYGLACLAGYLVKHGTSVAIIDAKFERLSVDETVQRALSCDPKVIGLTAFTNEIKPAATVAERIKRIRPEVVTVIGGVHVSALPKETLEEFPCFDIGVIGEGEITLQELCHALMNHTRLSSVHGVVYRTRRGLVVTSPRSFTADLDSLGPIAWHLLPSAPEYLVMTTRGCPYSCQFCMNPNGRLVRGRSPESMLQEIANLVDTYKPDRLWFCDEIFGSNKTNTIRLLDLIIETGINKRTKFWCETHVRFASEEFFGKLKQAGFWQVGFGVETGDPDKLKWLKKGVDLNRILQTRQIMQNVGLDSEGFFILGQPDETWESAVRTIQLATKLNLKLTAFGTMVPFPGTEVWEMAQRGEGGYRLISKDWNRYGKQLGGGALEFAHLSHRQIKLLQLYGYIRVLLWNFRFLDFVKFLWNYRREGIGLVKELLPPKWDEKAQSSQELTCTQKSTYVVASEDPLHLELVN